MGRPKASAAKAKKEKDPNKPKRPTSSYFYYVARQRQELEKQGKKVTRVAEWTKEVSAKWRELSEDDKKPFIKLAGKDKERYDTAMAAYKGKDVNKPKRPMSAYFLWLGDFRAKNKGKFNENKDLLRAAGENWRKLGDTDKKPYDIKAEGEKRKYEKAMQEYNAGGGPKAKKPKLEEAAKNGTDEEEEEEGSEEEGSEEEEEEEDDE